MPPYTSDQIAALDDDARARITDDLLTLLDVEIRCRAALQAYRRLTPEAMESARLKQFVPDLGAALEAPVQWFDDVRRDRADPFELQDYRERVA